MKNETKQKPAGKRADRKRQDRTLAEVRQELGECQRCKLHRKRKHIVFGSGNPEAKLVFVGKAPDGMKISRANLSSVRPESF